MNARPLLLRAAVGLAVAFVVAWIALRQAAVITVMRAFYDALGMGDVYGTRLRWSVWLGAGGAAAAVLLALPVLAVARAPRGPARPPAPREGAEQASELPTDDEISRMMARLEPADLIRPPRSATGDRTARRIGWGAFGLTALVLGAVLVPGAMALRDPLLAARNAQPFGVTDPVYGRDVAYTVFTVPALSAVVQLALVGFFLALCAVLAVAGALWYAETQRGGRADAESVRSRGLGWGLLLGGGLLAGIAAALWLSRYGILSTGDGTLAGPGRATRHIDLPARAVASIAVACLALVAVAWAVPAVRRAWMPRRQGPAAVWGLGAWAATAAVLVVISSAWWLVLLALVVLAGVLLHRGTVGDAEASVPLWALPAFAAATVAVFGVMGPIGARIYDAFVLRGPTYQVERQAIADSLAGTRRAAGLDAATVRTNRYARAAVTPADVRAAPASVASLRLLDIAAARDACTSREVPRDVNAYVCDDIDINRMTVDGRLRTVLVAGREIAPAARGDFQRTHLGLTHGYGVLVAPVDEVASDGQPSWFARGFPQAGLTPPLRHPEIYFGAASGAPWTLVNTDQPVLDGRNPATVITDWCRGDNAASCGADGGTGIALGSGWRRFAAATYVGGIPVAGDSRRALSAMGGDGTRLLLMRDIRTRVRELAPFLRADADPYFAPAGGTLWVVVPLYTHTARYPYAAAYGDSNYMRQPAVAAMDAYSGRTYLFVLDPDEPMLATWRRVYPGLFTPGERMDAVAPGLRAQLRYGEDVFAFQSAAAERYHVSDPQLLANGSAQWAEGWQRQDDQSVPSNARYAVWRDRAGGPERFGLIRTYTGLSRDGQPPSTMAGMLSASSDPATLGALTLDRFTGDAAPSSLTAFGGRITNNADMAQQLKLQSAPAWGDTMVVPVGRGLLYVLPIYLRTQGTGTPAAVFRVVVSTGGDDVAWGRTLPDALVALRASSGAPVADDGAGVPELAARAQAELEAYNAAMGSGDYAAAARHLAALRVLLGRLNRGARTP
ncbi:MAG: UPF0182 family protein [Thermoleophilia bacterium]|nr:UPF0182 family protein [Thermoleophilia bacterium]